MKRVMLLVIIVGIVPPVELNSRMRFIRRVDLPLPPWAAIGARKNPQ